MRTLRRLKFMSSPSLSDLGKREPAAATAADERGTQQRRACANATWDSIHNGVIAVFQRKGLPDQELFSLNEGVRQLLKTELGSFFTEYLQNQLLTKGMVILRDKIRFYEDAGLAHAQSRPTAAGELSRLSSRRRRQGPQGTFVCRPSSLGGGHPPSWVPGSPPWSPRGRLGAGHQADGSYAETPSSPRSPSPRQAALSEPDISAVWGTSQVGGGTPECRERELKRQGPFTNLVPRETSRSQAWVVWSGRLANLQSAALATRLPRTPTHHTRVSPADSWSGFPLGVLASSRGLSDTPQRPARPEPAAFTPALCSFQAEGLRVQHLAFPGDAQSQRGGTSKCPSPEGLSTCGWRCSFPLSKRLLPTRLPPWFLCRGCQGTRQTLG
ncbi:proline-rich protein 5 isoform X4 [Bubalus bubalis]|uniref:proline-rich protein 5 isoform X4 n=1 Tax=Bubalus bubalis TaxID=89462 RepID=UPI001E1B8979|nr:proline-rich protein 5 isoform X4 [Bubalus bubalis]